ncbi:MULTISPECIES: hypothetical protein [unclassified Novosphingobium]|uniref:hypothetical protein n=1 Tax=unclassified Novosphingobium TaxID=2644732 RepID=UPI00086C2487|nr:MULTISPECIES: hypothetical protein [unclassified Novosphingobium]MBN9143079.1 hypothetical protein [Novosphingobium sp.]ODU84791.1 MAG: hypothetical protein ABT10_00560 [Novosphingobium sp. SCN 63-17]OJX89428.1 MAG: hypothetical protein BGP00_14505 [Novosphingobium sp. 63-713]
MGARNGIPMDRSDWFHRLDELARTIKEAQAGQEIHLLRLFLDLLDHAPETPLLQGLMPPSRDRIEAVLAVGAMESAAMILMGEDSGFCLSRGADGTPLASVLLPYRFAETTSGGASLTLACLGALAGALNGAQGQMAGSAQFDIPADTLLH